MLYCQRFKDPWKGKVLWSCLFIVSIQACFAVLAELMEKVGTKQRPSNLLTQRALHPRTLVLQTRPDQSQSNSQFISFLEGLYVTEQRQALVTVYAIMSHDLLPAPQSPFMLGFFLVATTVTISNECDCKIHNIWLWLTFSVLHLVRDLLQIQGIN